MKSGSDPVKAYYSKCMQTDVPGAIRSLRAGEPKSKAALALLRKVERRFVLKREVHRVRVSDPLVKRVICAYRDYYRDALLNLARLDALDQRLEDEVRAIAAEEGLPVRRAKGWAAVERLLTAAFRERGYRALFGKVTPLKSLLVWQRERQRSFSVSLAEGREQVKVVFLEDFVELGWMHYASFGRFYVGGWAKKDALYCVAQGYCGKLKREAFTVSYLTHEAQHFSDYRRFTGLSQSDLEFRAKLAELAASSRPARLLKKFISEAKNDPKLPHSFAAFQVVRALGRDVAGNRLARAAREQLVAHSSVLRNASRDI